ncbi:NADH:ubiquinone oxidoreductase, C subunit [Luminiphilus syltensis NOR5-1B]|uniref:Na(+)-translocating NADH-quinone reductase subunit C n=1 Tax=Luminiphilus syltensis NOR5-1B TaxID=565045 RepID=B8KYI3_9GAMM|nr:Na(+)-translocating NADH-quinone reductase subunit C [Luminiphilus syltensis]EED35980.1 NADH:ubiquinone oxidoreductase, C subunit [Luminiphilus syltensis NOR5-1B]
MSSRKEGLGRILTVALALCVVCSVVVSTAAVMLKPHQEVNRTRDLKRNILMAAGQYDPGASVEAQFEQVTTKVVDLDTGKYVDGVDAMAYDQREAARDPAQSEALAPEEDPAKIRRRANHALVYLFNNADGDLDKVVLPVHGSGLWSTLYGFVALQSDANTIAGLGFYEHGETPGLGGEVDNPRWKSIWEGKKAYRDQEVAISVVKGSVDPTADGSQWRVDGLSGATLTSKGVHNLVQYWLGEDGFKPYLSNLRKGDV